MIASTGFPVLVVRAGTLSCAIPLGSVAETMRALPLRRLPSTPPYILGASVIRGIPTAVLDLTVLLGGERAAPATRFVLLRGATEPVALAVEAIEDVRRLPEAEAERLPRLLRDVGAHHVGSLGTLDAELVPILAATVALPADVAGAARLAFEAAS